MSDTQYIGIPYRWAGRDFDGVDCYGLVCLFYKNEFGIELDAYFLDAIDGWDTMPAGVIDLRITSIWHQVSFAQRGDLLLFGHRGWADHITVALNNDRMLDITETVGSHIAPMHRRSRTLRNIWRHKDMMI